MTDRKDDRRHLHYLNELSDFKVDSDDPDVRGWPVKDADNRVVGKVDNLLVSKEKKRVVYLDVEVDKSIIEANHDPYGNPASGDVHEFINKDGENHLILPIGLARLNLDDKFVYSEKINHKTFAETKRMEKGYDVDRDYEVVVLDSYNRDFDDEDRNLDQDAERKRMQEADKARVVKDKDQPGRDSLKEDQNRSTRKDSGRISDDDSFYDRGEFDRTKYRDKR